MFNIDAAELLFIIVLAIVMFGPEKVPQFSRKLARVFVALRDIANNAQTQLRDELGPEYANLNISDLNPKSLVKKHLSGEIQAIEEARLELKKTSTEFKDAVHLTDSDTDLEPSESKPKFAIFDREAT